MIWRLVLSCRLVGLLRGPWREWRGLRKRPRQSQGWLDHPRSLRLRRSRQESRRGKGRCDPEHGRLEELKIELRFRIRYRSTCFSLLFQGGWAGGSADSKDFVKNADLMWKQSVWSSSISAVLAAKHLKEGGCLVLPGAKPALGGTPGKSLSIQSEFMDCDEWFVENEWQSNPKCTRPWLSRNFPELEILEVRGYLFFEQSWF